MGVPTELKVYTGSFCTIKMVGLMIEDNGISLTIVF